MGASVGGGEYREKDDCLLCCSGERDLDPWWYCSSVGEYAGLCC